jgi:uncharacterized membrane protein YfhO
MKPLSLLIILLSVAAPVEAKQNKNQAAKNKQAELQKKKEKEEHDKKREAINKVLEAKDKNHDGSLTKEEYLTGEADQAAASQKFDAFNKNGDRSLTRSELEASLGL